MTTHVFFNRELRSLEALGADVRVVSTRRPPAGKTTHEWAAARMRETEYLWPMSAPAAARALAVVARAGPAGWWRAVRLTIGARESPWRERLAALPLLLPAARLKGWADDHGIRHVHSHFPGRGTMTVALAHALGLESFSVGAHGALDDFGGLQRSKWGHASFGVAITNVLLAAVKAELGPAAPAVWGVAPMGVETDRYRRSRPYEPYRGTGRFRVFSCGRLNPAKGHHVLIRAVAALADRGLPVELRIAGGDDHPDLGTQRALDALVAELGLGDAVTLLGPVPEATVTAELDRAHAFALATLAEGMGVSTMEAMAFGLPCVSSRVGGVPELIDSGVDGLLVEPGSVAALAGALETLIRDPGLAERLGRAAREEIEASFQPTRSAALLLELIASTGR